MSPIDLNVICAMPKTAAFVAGLTGWSRETGIDARYLKMIATSATAPNVPGGQDTHTHVATTHGSGHGPVAAHGHTTWPNTGLGGAGSFSDFNGYLGSGLATQLSNHSHAIVGPSTDTIAIVTDGPTAWSTENAIPPSLLVIFIKSDGTPTGFPPDAILYALGTVTGWPIADGTGGTDNAVNKMLRGAVGGGDGGAAAGTGNAHPHTMVHAHAQTQHQHTTPTDTYTTSGNMGNSVNPSGNVDPISHNHNGSAWLSNLSAAVNTGSATDTSNNGDITPPWHKIIPVQNKTGTLSVRKGLIAFWLGALGSINTAKWQLCDGTNGTQNLCQDKYIMGAAGAGEVGNTGGTTTHPHTAGGHFHTNPSHLHGQPQSPADGSYGSGISGMSGGMGQTYPAHVHNSGGNSSSDAPADTSSVTPTVTAANNTPSYNTVAFIQLMVDEGAPILISSD